MQITNNTQETLRYLNHEDTDDAGEIGPGGVQGTDIPIPWCWSQSRFNNDHWLELRFVRPGREDPVFAIYQAAREDGDFVRLSRSLEQGVYQDPGAPIGKVDRKGNRWTLVVKSNEQNPPPEGIEVQLFEIP